MKIRLIIYVEEMEKVGEEMTNVDSQHLNYKISRRIQQFKGSPTVQIFSRTKELERQGREILHLDIGQPDFAPLDSVLDATIKAIRARKTEYSVSSGLLELRSAIASHVAQHDGCVVDPKSEVLVTSGAKLALLAVLFSVLDEGDEVIIFDPYWVSYAEMVRLAGGLPRIVAVDPRTHGIDFDSLETTITPDTRAIIVNSPNNPTGWVISKEERDALFSFAQDRDLLIISDEIYSEYVFDGEKHWSFSGIDGWKKNAVVINGFSKTYSMTGYRLAWILGASDILGFCRKFIENSTTCPVTFAQYGAIAALQHHDEFKTLIKELFPPRREIVLDWVKSTKAVSAVIPRGAFYVFAAYDLSMSPTTVALRLLEEYDVSVIPGTAFGSFGKRHLRIAYASSVEVIKKALGRMTTFFEENQG